ncbi:MAG: hypothetical protein PHR64_03425, partial [Candidatus Shapirobacteria bacterium]|nr:hypothetical protein [Candidatus Shapirobacteria bacterium]
FTRAKTIPLPIPCLAPVTIAVLFFKDIFFIIKFINRLSLTWWSILDKVRTHFQENPTDDF